MRELDTSLKRSGFAVGEIHGDMDQRDRIAELDRFKKDEINILVASDVAARGLDIKGVSHVFNFDVPWHPDDYVHRIGRTGRAGATRHRLSRWSTREDAEEIDKIEKLTGKKIAEMTLDGGEKPAREEAPGVRRDRAKQTSAPRPPSARRWRQKRGPSAARAPCRTGAPS